jgi:ATP-binding cassette subfamily B (MDR/TAP) protein 1
MEFFDRPENASGALTSKLSAFPTQLQELLSGNIMLIIVVFVNLVSSSILAIAYGWKLGLTIVFGGLPPIVISGYLRIRLETKIEEINGERFAESASLASEAVGAIRTVASLTIERPILNQYSDMLDSIVRRSIKSLLWTMFWFALSQSLDFLVEALGFWYGGHLLASGEYTTGQFYIIFIGVLFAGQAASQFFGYSTSLTKAVGAANYILWLRTLKPTMQENDQNRDNGPEGDSAIRVQEVEFNYKQREASRVLRGISMTVRLPGIKVESFVTDQSRLNQVSQSASSAAAVAGNQL